MISVPSLITVADPIHLLTDFLSFSKKYPMNYLKLYSFGLTLIACYAAHFVQSSTTYQLSSHCDSFSFTHLPVQSFPFQKIIFAASKYDNVPSNTIVNFTRFNGKPLTFSSPTTTDGMAS